MLRKIMKSLTVFVFAIVGFLLAESVAVPLMDYASAKGMVGGFLSSTVLNVLIDVGGALFFGFIGILLGPILVDFIMKAIEVISEKLTKLPTVDIFIMALGVIIGLIVATLLGTAFSKLPIVGPYITLILSVIGAVVGANVAVNKSDEIISLFSRLKVVRPSSEGTKKTTGRVDSSNYKMLDTSVLIDGRIVDVIKTGFLEGTIVIPHFVLEELQKIADSADTLKRNRGRRGLDIVKAIQANKLVKVEISNVDYDDTTEVDTKLLRLAKDWGGVVATNDFNLSKVADIQGVRILNINDLANALKQAVLPGEEMQIFLAKEGKEPGQAIGYLDDGTMIVVESGKRSVNFTVPVIVTSVLQTSAGRMIFAKLK